MAPDAIWDVVHYIRSLRKAPADEPLEALWLPRSANAQGEAIDHDFLLTLGVTGTLGVLVLAALLAAVGRGIVRRGETPPHRPGTRWVEVLWIAIPTAIVLVMIVNSLVLYADLTREIPGALRVKVTGRQFFWSFEYPESGAVSTGTCAIPAGRPVHFEIVSEDVIHSFFLPHLKMKRDALPGFMTHLWVQPLGRTGAYPILCNQFCGTDHAIMNGTLRVLPPEDFENWLALHGRAP
jgi:cytochrome c oxidase subunit 2